MMVTHGENKLHKQRLGTDVFYRRHVGHFMVDDCVLVRKYKFKILCEVCADQDLERSVCRT